MFLKIFHYKPFPPFMETPDKKNGGYDLLWLNRFEQACCRGLIPGLPQKPIHLCPFLGMIRLNVRYESRGPGSLIFPHQKKSRAF